MLPSKFFNWNLFCRYNSYCRILGHAFSYSNSLYCSYMPRESFLYLFEHLFPSSDLVLLCLFCGLWLRHVMLAGCWKKLCWCLPCADLLLRDFFFVCLFLCTFNLAVSSCYFSRPGSVCSLEALQWSHATMYSFILVDHVASKLCSWLSSSKWMAFYLFIFKGSLFYLHGIYV